MSRTPAALSLTLPAITALALAIAASIGASRGALAAEAAAESPVTPFIDSGNTLPDLAAREAASLTRGKWYGGQILLADLASMACVAGAGGICVIPFLFAAPTIHAVHNRPALAALSGALRLLGPMLGASIGRSFANCPDRPPPSPEPPTGNGHGGPFVPSLDFASLCGLEYATLGAVVGAAGAIAVDLAFAFEAVPVETPPDATVARAPAISPQVSLAPGGLTLGLGARF